MYIRILSYILFISIISFHLKDIFSSFLNIHLYIVELEISLYYYIFSTIVFLFVHKLFRSKIFYSLPVFSILSLLLNSILNSYFSEIIILIFYTIGIVSISRFILLKLKYEFRILESILLGLAVNFLMVYFEFSIDAPLRESIIITSLVGFGGSVYFLVPKIDSNDFIFKYLSSGESRELKYIDLILIFLYSLFLELLLMLLNQPIIEWDSSVAHIPLLNYFLTTNSLKPNPQILQSYFINFHQISALPFYFLSGELGLKFFNSLFLISFMLIFSLLSKELNKSLKIDGRLFLILMSILSVSLFSTQVGTFQYDISLPFLYGSVLYYMIRIVSHSGSILTNTQFLSLAIIIGTYIKLNFLISILPIGLFFIGWFLFYNRSYYPILIKSFLILTIFLLLLPLKSFIFTGTFIHPFGKIMKHGAPDWNTYGLQNTGYFLKYIYYIYGYTFDSNYGHFERFTGGFIYFFSIFSFYFFSHKKIRLIYIFLFSSLGILIIQIQYARYVYYILSFIPIILIYKERNLIFENLKTLILSIIIFVQLLGMIKMNWWVKMNALSLVSGYEVKSFESQIKGEEYLLFKDIVGSIQNSKTLFLVDHYWDRFNWASKEKNTFVVPVLWTSSLDGLFEGGVDNFISNSKKFQFDHIIITNYRYPELYSTYASYYSSIENHLELIRANKLFSVYKIKY